MTFTEAALEVLRSAGEPLHYKKITELAIERNLLSHVGKTPEVTMSSRLAMMVKKDRGQAPIIKVKPGVFAIRESALQGQELSAAALAAIHEIEGVDEAAALPEVTEEPKPPVLPGSDVFPEEEGDDDPILAGLEQESETGERAGRRRRRRRRRGKGTDKGEPGNEVSTRPEAPRESGRSERVSREYRSNGREPGGREPGERERVRVRAEDAGTLDWSRQPADGDLLGKDLADAVWLILSRGDRIPHSYSRIAELLVRKGRLSGTPAALAPTIAAAVRADIARAERDSARPRFRLRGARMVLSEWLQPKSLQRADQDLLAASERYAHELRRALIQKLGELPTAGFAELVATWLNAEGVTALRAVRRPGSSGSELHFAGTRKIGSEELRLAIVVQRAGRDIDREAVIDVRGALHHYGQANAAWIVTTGRVTSGAREEAAMQTATACALFDGMGLAAAMERLGIAVRRHVVAYYELDHELLEDLGDTPEQRERRERELERERKRAAERERAAQRASEAPAEPPRAARGARGRRVEKVDEEAVEQEEAKTLVPAQPAGGPDWEPEEDEIADELRDDLDLDQAEVIEEEVIEEEVIEEEEAEVFTEELDESGEDESGEDESGEDEDDEEAAPRRSRDQDEFDDEDQDDDALERSREVDEASDEEEAGESEDDEDDDGEPQDKPASKRS